MQRSRCYLAQSIISIKRITEFSLYYANIDRSGVVLSLAVARLATFSWTKKYFTSVFGYCVEEQAMVTNRYRAELMVLVLLVFCTFGRCTTELSFLRDRNMENDMENDITLRCRRATFDIPNARFYVNTPEGGRRLLTQEQSPYMFTLTSENEGNFTCVDPTTNEVSAGLLLAGEEMQMAFPQIRVQLNSKYIL